MALTAELPDLSSRYAVSPADVESYRRDGHVLLPGVASQAEVAAYREVIESAATDGSEERPPLAERDLYGRAFLQTMNLWRGHEGVARFVLARRFAGVAAALLGVERVRLYHDQALFKEAGGGITPWHQDAGYWPLDGERCLTMWMPLQDVRPEMGTLQFASGTNAAGSLGDLVISQESEDHFTTVVQGRYAVTPPVSLAAGDATFHGGWTVHRAFPNTTDRMRAVMTVIWFADGTTVLGDLGEHQRNDLATWLPGCGPGDVAGGELNPVLAGDAPA